MHGSINICTEEQEHMALICGIDEAGRGPVIGPLVLCGAIIEERDEKKLKALGVRDSKLLSPAQRERLFDELQRIVRYECHTVLPAEIDTAVESETTNLNWLEADHTAAIINALKPAKAYVDCPSPNINAYLAYLKGKVTVDCAIIAEHKADAKYPIVSAASILAKVSRDREIAKIQQRFTEPMGSGYPADARTVEFMEKNYQKYPEIFRRSWASYKRLAGEGKKQRKLGEFSAHSAKADQR